MITGRLPGTRYFPGRTIRYRYTCTIPGTRSKHRGYFILWIRNWPVNFKWGYICHSLHVYWMIRWWWNDPTCMDAKCHQPGMVGTTTRVPISRSHMLGHSNHNHLFVYSKSAGVGSYNDIEEGKYRTSCGREPSEQCNLIWKGHLLVRSHRKGI